MAVMEGGWVGRIEGGWDGRMEGRPVMTAMPAAHIQVLSIVDLIALDMSCLELV